MMRKTVKSISRENLRSQSACLKPGRSPGLEFIRQLILELLPLHSNSSCNHWHAKGQELQLPGGARAVLNSRYSGAGARSAGNCSPQALRPLVGSTCIRRRSSCSLENGMKRSRYCWAQSRGSVGFHIFRYSPILFARDDRARGVPRRAGTRDHTRTLDPQVTCNMASPLSQSLNISK